jgi:hypothetical protein
VTENYINTALSVYEHICTEPALSRCIDQLEQRFGLSSCLSNMTALQIIVTRTTVPFRKWTMEGIVDSVLAGIRTNDDITTVQLRHLCPLFQFRREVLTRCLGVDLPKLGVGLSDLELFRTMLADHHSYRTHVCGFPDDPAVDLKWQADCLPSSIVALKFLEDPPRR